MVATEEIKFHAGGEQSWVTGSGTLALFRSLLKPGDRTVETGSGASTVLFAEIGTNHTAISPFADEHARIRQACEGRGFDTSHLEFIAASSDLGLPRLVERRDVVDFVFIDGKHAFPLPVIDFHYADQLLRVGGVLVVDDVPIRAVGLVCHFLDESKAWERIGCADDRALAYRKLASAPLEDDWERQAMNRDYPDFWFLEPARRAYMTARARASIVKNRLKARLLRA
jgi:hypothetical protein